MNQVADTVKASKIVWDTIAFHDIAGLVAGAHKGEGLGNQFLANIRETDALLHVVRAHTDSGIVHSEGSVDPMRDIATIETELIYADLEQAERRLERVVRQARGGDKHAIAEQRWLEQVIVALQEGKPVRTVPVPDDAPDVQVAAWIADLEAGAVRGQRQRGRDRGSGRDRRICRVTRRARGRGVSAARGRARSAEPGGGSGDARRPRPRRVGPADGRTRRL